MMNNIIKKGWIARDKDNELWFFSVKPHKEYNAWWSNSDCENGEDNDFDYEELDSELFPEISWEDEEPIEVEIEYTIKKI